MKAVSLLTSPPAGLGTLDPLPLRQDQWPPNSVSDKRVSHNSAHEEHSSVPPLLKSARSCPVSCWSPSPRIQGTLKDPEFQHNGGFCLLTGRVSVRGWKWLPCSILALMAIKNVVFVNGSFSTVSCWEGVHSCLPWFQIPPASLCSSGPLSIFSMLISISTYSLWK